MALVVKNLPANAGDVRDVGLIPGRVRCPGGGHGNPLQCILAYRISWTEVYITCTLYVPCNTHFPGITVLTPGNTMRMTVCSSLASLPRSPTQCSALLQKSDRQRVRTCHPQQRPSTGGLYCFLVRPIRFNIQRE